MNWLRVRKWEQWQSYRSDRSQPPWIKLHRRLILDPDFVMLGDSEKAHLMCIWIVAADRNGMIPDDAPLIKKIAGLDTCPDLDRLQALGFLEQCNADAKATPKRRQSDSKEAPQTRLDTDTDKIKRAQNVRFAEWWNAYQKKVNRKGAQRIWKRRKLDTMADKLIADAKNRHAHCAKWAAGYQPNPTTYLNQDRWDDEIQTAKEQPDMRKKLFVPQDDDSLVPFAKSHGLPDPGRTESYREYRHRLVALVRQGAAA